MIEHSIRMTPGSYRTHWAMAVVCNRLGWNTAAHASLLKMNTLLPDTALFDLTRLVFIRPNSFKSLDGVPEASLSMFFPEGCDTIGSVQLALLGIETDESYGSATIRERFFGRLIKAALTSSRPKQPRAELLS